MLTLLQTDTEKVKELIVPDSIQKAQFTEAVHKISSLNYHELLNDIAKNAAWIAIKVVLAIIIYYIGRQIIKWVIRLMDRAFLRHKIEASLQKFLRSLTKALMMIMLLLVIVQTLGINTSSILAMFASAGLAIGMALSGTLQNFAGGVILLILRPYKVGDYIEAQGQSGTVESIGLFSTCLKTVDNQTIYVPNSAISSSVIDNYSQSKTRRIEWILSISYGDDIDVARKEILAIIASDQRILKVIEPVVLLKNLGASSVDLSIRVWVNNEDYWNVFYDINERMYKELPTKGVNFPFPQMDVHIKNS